MSNQNLINGVRCHRSPKPTKRSLPLWGRVSVLPQPASKEALADRRMGRNTWTDSAIAAASTRATVVGHVFVQSSMRKYFATKADQQASPLGAPSSCASRTVQHFEASPRRDLFCRTTTIVVLSLPISPELGENLLLRLGHRWFSKAIEGTKGSGKFHQQSPVKQD